MPTGIYTLFCVTPPGSVCHFPSIGPEAQSNHATVRFKYVVRYRKNGYLSRSGCGIKSGKHSTFLARKIMWLPRGSRAPVPFWPSAGGSPWPGRRLGAFAQRDLALCTCWATCREAVIELFGLFFAQSARFCGFTLGWRWRAAQSENQPDTCRFAINKKRGMASTRA
jgi:hypothetical protein